MTSRITLVLMILLIVPAYASDPSMQNSKSVAHLRLATNTPHVATAYQYADASCQANEIKMFGLRAGTLFRSKESRLGIPLWDFHKNGAKEIEIPTGKFVGKFEGVADGGSVGAKCDSAFSLDAEAGHDYEVFFDFPGAGCSVRISEIVTNSAGLATRIELEQTDELGPECTKRKFRL